MSMLRAIPTNIITGFLGVGKTTAILNLLERKPADERWAVLVNEFGEVGIDGTLLAGQQNGGQGVFIREVPGGCMCCSAGLPMQVALNMLLARAKPQRLLIEPTGLGHPKEVLGTLAAEHYRDLLNLRATVTLVDARKVHDSRYTDHDTFNQQLEVADVIVANKADQYTARDFPALLDYLDGRVGLGRRPVFQVSRGALQLDWLNAPAARLRSEAHHHHSVSAPLSAIPEAPELPLGGYVSLRNAGDGFHSRGWIFDANWIFDEKQLHVLLLGTVSERIKGVFITDQGVYSYNKVDNVLTRAEVDDSFDSRIECISADRRPLDALERALLDCVVAR